MEIEKYYFRKNFRNKKRERYFSPVVNNKMEVKMNYSKKIMTYASISVLFITNVFGSSEHVCKDNPNWLPVEVERTLLHHFKAPAKTIKRNNQPHTFSEWKDSKSEKHQLSFEFKNSRNEEVVILTSSPNDFNNHPFLETFGWNERNGRGLGYWKDFRSTPLDLANLSITMVFGIKNSEDMKNSLDPNNGDGRSGVFSTRIYSGHGNNFLFGTSDAYLVLHEGEVFFNVDIYAGENSKRLSTKVNYSTNYVTTFETSKRRNSGITDLKLYLNGKLMGAAEIDISPDEKVIYEDQLVFAQDGSQHGGALKVAEILVNEGGLGSHIVESFHEALNNKFFLYYSESSKQ
ncbi:MAG: hypothetical protein CL678_15025 [Bdellovibrionaceae bacterium]|nr:hypothetical protein [Pseudobdellovibrionaceae bacterium]